MSTAQRKAASWLNAAVLAFALTACCVLCVLMTTRVHRRFDRTATRQHDLSPRTHQLLDRLDRDLTLVVAADFGSIDHATHQRTSDVLEQFSTASKRLKVTVIDTSSAAGQGSYEAVVADLARRDKPTIDAASGVIAKAADRCAAIAGSLDSIQQLLLDLKNQHVAGSGSLLNDQYLSTQAAVLRVALQDLRTGAGNAKAHLGAVDPLVPAPAIDKARAELVKPVAAASGALNVLADAFDSLAKDPAAKESDKAAAGVMLPPLREARNAAGSLSADLENVDIPRVLKIARALQLRRAALLIDENARPGLGAGVTAIDADALLAVGGQGVDLRARTEDLIAGAVATMSSGVRPIVCIVHGAPKSLAAADWAGVQRVRQQLSMRGIDLVEWPVAIMRDMPNQVVADSPSRPVVFVTVTAGSGRDSPQSAAAGIAAFSKALDALVSSGRNVLLSVQVSPVAASGSPDPLTECLKPLGIEVDSGRPLLHAEKVDTRTVAVPREDVLDPHATHAISGAINGLRLRMQWPVAVTTAAPGAGVRAEPIVSIPADGAHWAESEWQEFYGAVGRLKGDFTRIANPPGKDSPRDGAAAGAGWTVVMAVENAAPQRPRQRLVVVGVNGWFLDDLTDVQAELDGRATPLFPGNLQLLESSVHWLAGQDDQILRGAAVASIATIPPMTDAQQSWLRWLLVAIMPALALAAGVAYRALKP